MSRLHSRQVACKHIYAVYFSLNFREHVTTRNLNLALEITSPDQEQCSNCGSAHIQKWGWKHRKDGSKVQRYKCMFAVIEIVSVITKTAAQNLGLKEGKEVYTIIKATNVMLGTD